MLNCNTEKLLNILSKKLGNKYDYSLVEYIDEKLPIKIICKEHGIFERMPTTIICGNIKCLGCSGKVFNLKTFIDKASKIHNNQYSYDKVIYVSNGKKVIITCKIHGDFLQVINSHLSGNGCPSCSGNTILSTEKFIFRSKEIYGDKYNYDKTIYLNMYKEIIITCPDHGDFTQLPVNHLSGHQCKKCSVQSLILSTDEFINRAKNIHKNKYNYSKANYIKSYETVSIICQEHGEFKQIASAHLRGCGCPNCTSSISNSEIEWLDFLNIPKEYRQKTIKINLNKIRVDGYVPEDNMVYEFYGDFWHGNPRIYPHNKLNTIRKLTFGYLYDITMAREKAIIDAGYKITTIWEMDWKEIKSIKI